MSDRERDAFLLKSVAAGDTKACRTLVDENLKPMLGLAYQMLGNLTEAEDVAQEAFLRLWKQAPSWRADAKIKVWLYRVVHNLCIDRLRKNKRVSGEEVPEVAENPTQAGDIHDGEVAAIVNEAIFTLPERQRTAITLVHLQEESNKNAAKIMGVSVEALESLLARGRRTLRGKLEKQKGDLIGGL